MNSQRSMLFLALAVLLSLGGCAGTKQVTKSVSSGSSSETSVYEKTESELKTNTADKDEAAADSAEGSAESAALDVSGRLPYKGMPAVYINETWLGAADEVGEVLAGGKYAGAVPYDWFARNGTDDLVFTAYVKNDEVVGVSKSNLGKNYWGDGSSVVSSDLPDLEASGESVGKNGSASTAKPNPDGWDDAEDYANANSSRFTSWDEAYDYWLEEMG